MFSSHYVFSHKSTVISLARTPHQHRTPIRCWLRQASKEDIRRHVLRLQWRGLPGPSPGCQVRQTAASRWVVLRVSGLLGKEGMGNGNPTMETSPIMGVQGVKTWELSFSDFFVALDRKFRRILHFYSGAWDRFILGILMGSSDSLKGPLKYDACA